MANARKFEGVGMILVGNGGGKTTRCLGLIHQKKLKTQSTQGKSTNSGEVLLKL